MKVYSKALGRIIDTEEQASQPQQQRSVGGFLGNVLRSGGEAVTGIGGALLNVFNPNLEKNTIANLARLGIGAGELLIPGEQGAEQYARNVGNIYNQRYGITDILKGDLGSAGKKIGTTLYEDPVGAALDVSAVLSGGGGLLSKTGKLSNAGRVVSKVGATVDPLQAMGRVLGPKAGKLISSQAAKMEEFGNVMPTKILKASAPRVAKFEEVLPKGKTINDFIVENDLIGPGNKAFQKADQLIQKSQAEYNALARSKTKTIVPTDYVAAIEEEIKRIGENIYTPGAKQTIAELEKIRDSFLEGVAKNKELKGVPIDKFTNIKTSTIGKAGKLEPYKLDAERIAGNAMINVIEKYAPGSAALGKRLQQLREFKNLASRVPTGKNTNILGILKPSGTGAALGAIVGGVPGAVVGAGAGLASQNPLIMQLLGKSATSIGKKAPVIAGQTGRGLASMETAGNLARLLTPVNQQNQPDQQQVVPEVQQPIIPQDQQPLGQQPPAVQQQTFLTGRSPEQHYRAYQKAVANGDTRAASQIYRAFEDETAYQKANKSKVGNVTSSVDMMEQLYAPGTDTSLSMGKKTVGIEGVLGKAGVEIRKQTDQEYADRLNSYKTQMALVAGAINQAAGAGVLNGGEYERLAMKSFPNEYTSEAVAKAWFDNARKVLNSLPDNRSEQLQQILSGQ